MAWFRLPRCQLLPYRICRVSVKDIADGPEMPCADQRRMNGWGMAMPGARLELARGFPQRFLRPEEAFPKWASLPRSLTGTNAFTRESVNFPCSPLPSASSSFLRVAQLPVSLAFHLRASPRTPGTGRHLGGTPGIRRPAGTGETSGRSRSGPDTRTSVRECGYPVPSSSARRPSSWNPIRPMTPPQSARSWRRSKA